MERFSLLSSANQSTLIIGEEAFYCRLGQICWGVSLESPELASLDDEIVSSLSEMLGRMEGLVDYLVSKRREDARWIGILSVMLVLFLGVAGVLIVNLLAEIFVTRFFVEHPGSNLVFLAFLSTFSIIVG